MPTPKKRSKHRHVKREPIIFILWGEGGEEVSVALFVQELRAAGRLVKLVGLGSTRIRGGSGLVFVPDLTIGDALELVDRAELVILPFGDLTLRRFTNDPRLEQFIDKAHEEGATFVQSEAAADAVSLSVLFDEAAGYRVVEYPVGEGLYGFVGEHFPVERRAY